MFTDAGRDAIRDELVARAEADDRVIGAALAARARARRGGWADVELALQPAPDADAAAVAAEWSAAIADLYGVADVLDEVADGARRRVHLLRSSLVVGVSFRARARHPPADRGFDADATIARGWLSAAEARAALAEGRTLGSTIQLDALRDRVVALCASRHGLDPSAGRGADALPWQIRDALRHARAGALTAAQLNGSRRRLLALLLDEARHRAPARADALAEPLGVLSADVAPR